MSRPQDNRLPYMPGIDALRALAVLAVFLYHAGVGWMPGGFLGVDVFFVISGYLITSLLLSEYRRGGPRHLWQFWLRRARRLLPAVGVLIAVTMVVAAIVVPEQMPQLRGDAIASLGYVANWHLIFSTSPTSSSSSGPRCSATSGRSRSRSSSTSSGRSSSPPGCAVRPPPAARSGSSPVPSPRWRSLDPVRAGQRRLARLLRHRHPRGRPARRRCPRPRLEPVGAPPRHPGRWAGPVLDAVGVFAVAFVVLTFLRVHDYDLGLYHGGYLWLALFTALLVAVLAHPAARLGGLLAQPPMVWLGLRSYSFYLWHWPVLVLPVPGSTSRCRGRAGAAAAAGGPRPRRPLLPLRRAALRRRGRLPKLPRGWGRLTRPVLATGVLAVVVLIGWSGSSPPATGHLAQGAAAASTRSSAVVKVSYRGGSEASGARRSRPGAPRLRGKPPRIVAIGDSVMIGARDQLAERLGPSFSMNARLGRQAKDFVKLVHKLRAHHRHPDALVIQMGNNGPLYSDDMAAFHHYSRDLGHLFLINDEAPVSWEGDRTPPCSRPPGSGRGRAWSTGTRSPGAAATPGTGYT